MSICFVTSSLRTIRFCALVCVSIGFQLNVSADEPKETSFQSAAAKNAVAKYEERLAFLEKRLDEQISIATKALKSDLAAALKVAVENQDFAEANRLSTVLENDMKSFAQPTQDAPSQTPDKTGRLQVRIAKLESDLSKLEAPDRIVGHWDYHNGNVCEYTKDGWVMLKGQPIGLWARGRDNAYAVAFLSTFAQGVSDRMLLQPDGNAITVTSSKRKQLQLDRVTK
ncbi:MAG: hypothetical protein AAGA03_02005 [Planctomycetota bacterium]